MGESTKLTRRCNLGCSYCYQTTARILKNATSAHDYDIDAVVKTITDRWEEQGDRAKPLTLHGGEPLLMKKEDLELLCKINYRKFGKCSIQTNGVLIDDDHLSIFSRYNVSPGVSIDGWGHLNISRQQSGNTAATLASTRKTLNNLRRLKDVGITPGMIVVLSKANATEETLPMDGMEPGEPGYYEEPVTRRQALFDFIQWTMSELGMSEGRLNPAHVDVPWLQPIVQLTNEELSNFWSKLVPWAFEHGYKFRQIEEVRDSLFGLGSHSTCTKTYCDPLHTTAEVPIQSDGSVGNCEHVYGTDGIPFLATGSQVQDERYRVVAGTDWKHGGCFNGPDGKSQGACKWWATCNAQCPGSAIDGDWRNRTRFCESWAALYQAVYDHTKKMIPNVVLLPDVAHNFDPHDLYAKVHSCDPPWDPYVLMKRGLTYSPSVWRPPDQETRKKSVMTREDQAKAVKQRQACTEHGDVIHGDHNDHGDSG